MTAGTIACHSRIQRIFPKPQVPRDFLDFYFFGRGGDKKSPPGNRESC
jgi:hypothetical protein